MFCVGVDYPGLTVFWLIPSLGKWQLLFSTKTYVFQTPISYLSLVTITFRHCRYLLQVRGKNIFFTGLQNVKWDRNNSKNVKHLYHTFNGRFSSVVFHCITVHYLYLILPSNLAGHEKTRDLNMGRCNMADILTCLKHVTHKNCWISTLIHLRLHWKLHRW